jgi:hypothetical protein
MISGRLIGLAMIQPKNVQKIFRIVATTLYSVEK